MTVKQRFVAALERRMPDRLPVTTHHIMPSFLQTYLDGADNDGFFARFGIDPVKWLVPFRPDGAKGQYYDPAQQDGGIFDNRRICTDQWRIVEEVIPGQKYHTVRYRIVTPGGELTAVLQSNNYTVWVTEHLVKQKRDIELIARYSAAPVCDVGKVNALAGQYGENALIRGHICSFDLFGQPGCWQDAACLYGIEKLIMETYDDPEWVHEFLAILLERKLAFTGTLKGAEYDALELGGGDASTTVISPAIFRKFVAPYDTRLITAAHAAGQRIVYHTCGGMMPILEDIAAMGADAMETFTPPGMGGDVSLKEAKRRIGDKVCMIGGFDQFHFFTGCTPEHTRAEVRRCFEEAGAGGGYILCPSDHFFDADIALIDAFAEEARKCTY